MEAGKNRNIKSGAQYDHLFPRATNQDHTILSSAVVDDTVAFIPKVVGKTLDHTKKLAALVKGRNDYQSCGNLWQFVYDHIAYLKDKDGYEQIRSPARAWHDRKSGVDCDCYTTFISSVLTNLGIRHKLRITKYSKDYFQHIYPVALLSGREVIVDCVTDKFDYEVPYSEKKDYIMELQYLNGTDDREENYLFGNNNGMEELGKLFRKKTKANAAGGGGKKKGNNIFKRAGAAVKKTLKKVDLKKVLNTVNKVNPATIALRNGLLASMKINVGNVAGRLRWSYISTDQARARGMDMGRWQKLVEVRQKLEKIFYGAGGKPENLKKAIIHGKGNKDNAVHGIDGLGRISDYGFHPNHPQHPLNRLHKHMPLRQLLGEEVFFSENSVGALGDLGEPISMAMIAAASGAVAAIAATLKKIGDIFKGKGSGAKDFDEDANKVAEKEIAENAGSSDSSGSAEKSDSDSGSGNSAEKSKRFEDNSSGSSDASGGGSDSGDSGGNTKVATTDNAGSAESEEGTNGGAGTKAVAKKESAADDEPKEGFWDKNKKWIVPTGIGVAGIGLLALALSSSKAPAAKPMHGTPARKKAATTRKTPPKKNLTSKGLL